LRKILYIYILVFLSNNIAFGQMLNGECTGVNIGFGSLITENLIGCVPFTLEVIKADTIATGYKYIYDYKGGALNNLIEQPTHIYSTPGIYQLLQRSYRKDNGQELRVCATVTVLDTTKLILKSKICGNKVSLDIIDGNKVGLIPYQYCLIDWDDGLPQEKVNLPTAGVAHTYSNQNDRKIKVTGRYEVSFCPTNSSILIIFPKISQPQISVLEKTGQGNFALSFNNFSGESVKVLANNVAIFTKTGEVGLQKITFANNSKNACYAIQLESNCFPNNISKELCDIDFEVTPTETSNELRWKQPKPEIIKDFTLTKNTNIKLPTQSIVYADTAIRCGQQNCYQISFRSNESMFISDKICVQNSLIKCFVSVPVYLPLAFSPNNDGINDTFLAKGELDKFMSLTIYDHFGKIITVITNPNDGWDGKDYLSGIYPYKLKVKDIRNNEIELTGKVLLLR
jgi:gliding motility-associated-like protein